MATSFVWPSGLPQYVERDSYSETGGVSVLRTPMDSGPAKVRRRAKFPSQLEMSVDMTSAQVAIFKTFVEDTIQGVMRFNFPHPRTGNLAEVRIVAEEGGRMYNLRSKGHDRWAVQFKLEVLP